MAGTSVTLKEALYETLRAILSPDAPIRKNAEQQIKVFEVTDEYGSHLTELALDPGINWPIRQLACVLLKQYIALHWSVNNDKFQAPEVNKEAKYRIRGLLVAALGEECDLTENGPEKKLKSSIAYAISGIAHYDWPDEWPDLFQVMVNYLSSRNRGAIYGSMKVFVEISHEVIDAQIPSVAPLLLPKMYEIFVDHQNFDIRTRGRAVQIFTVLAETIGVLGDYDKQSVKHYLDPVLPQFTEALVKVLQLPDSGVHNVDVGLKKDVLFSLTILLKQFKKRMWKWMPQILSPVWYSLTTSAAHYVKIIVNSEADDAFNSDFNPPVDSDGEVLGLENLIFAIFDFISVVIESNKSRKLIKDGLSDLIYYLLIYMQITDDQMQAWSANPDQFVEDEDDDSYSFSVRQSALEVLLSLAGECEESESKKEQEVFRVALVGAINKHFAESNQLKANPNNYFWWKVQESCLLALGSIAQSLIETIKLNDPLASDLKCILDNVFMTTTDFSPFFGGRSLWTAARFAAIMTPPIVDRFLQTTVSGLVNPSPVIKISSVRATYTFCAHLKETNQVNLLIPYLPPMLEALIAISTQHSTEVLALVLETISILVTADKGFTASVENKVAPLTIATFLRHSADPVLISITIDIFKELSKNEQCFALLQQRLVPTLLSILNPSQVTANNRHTFQTLQPVAMDILTTIVRNSPLPLSDVLVNQAFPCAANCVVNTVDDNPTMQNGGECIRAYVSKSMEQVAGYKDQETGRDGISLIMQVCLHLLDPRVNESCAAFVGRLISVVITKAAPVLGNDNSHLLLRSVLSKLQTSEALTVVQSLIMVFAHLINHDLETVLDFLSSLPGPTGSQSALEFVLIQWLNRQHMFYGAYENKVSIVALCKLLEHSVVTFNNGDQRLNLNMIQVPGEPVITDSPGIRTRSKSKANQQWTVIPCSVKILKLLLGEIRQIEVMKSGCFDSDEEYDEDDEEEADESSHEGIDEEHGSVLQTMIDEMGNEAEEEDEDDDEDTINDPIFKLNLGQHLTTFVRSFKSTPYYSQFYPQLNAAEKQLSDTL